MIFYYSITVVANIAAIIIFRNSINITPLSIMPLILVALLIFQSQIFKTAKIENGFDTNYGSDLTAKEKNEMYHSASKFMLAAIPFMIPFLFFFPSSAKILSVFVYIIGLVGGLAIYRIKSQAKIVDRLLAEENERKEQEIKEENGKLK